MTSSRSLILGKLRAPSSYFIHLISPPPPVYASVRSLTNADMVLATVRVKLAESDPEPKQKLDEGEHIVKRVVEVSELYNVLQGRVRFFPLV